MGHRKINNRVVIVDTETTGLSPKEGDRIVEVACIEISDDGKDDVLFHGHFNPGRVLEPHAQRITGLSDRALQGYPPFRTHAKTLHAILAGAVAVAHNASFDLSFLDMEMKKEGLPSLALLRVIDTLTLARRLFPGRDNRLRVLARRLGVNVPPGRYHSALADCRILTGVFRKLSEHALVMRKTRV